MKKQHKVETRLKWEIKVATGHHKKTQRKHRMPYSGRTQYLKR